MKTYQELMEVMSMDDMNKITGGTDAQRKIAQDRQRKREAKNRGFDQNKSVFADDKKSNQDDLAAKRKEAATDPLSKAAPGVKAPTAPTKDSAAQDPLKKASSSIVKAQPQEVEKRKPDLRKSQIGKWSQGIKNSSSQLAKRSESKPAVQDVKKVNVKVDEPKRTAPSGRDNMEGQAGQRPGTTKEVGKGVVDNMKEKRKSKLLKRAKRLARTALRKANEVDFGRTGISTSSDLEGLSGKQSYD